MRKIYWFLLVGNFVVGSFYHNGGVIVEHDAGRACYCALWSIVFALLLIDDRLKKH